MSTIQDRTLLPGLTGVVPVRNAESLGYCWKVAIESMLPIVSEVIVSDGGSTDQTLPDIEEWLTREPKLKLVHYPWENPVGDVWFLSKWINWTLQNHARYNMQCQLDADEVFDPSSYSAMRDLVRRRRPGWFHRVNLWQDPWHEAPHGTVCAERAVRIGPIEYPAVCDNLHPSEPWVNVNGEAYHYGLRIWHLGFLRDQDKFLKKAREIMRMLLNTHDQRLAECEQTGQKWFERCPFPPNKPLIKHALTIPENVKPWLRERGFKL